jgi:hypothetical protein
MSDVSWKDHLDHAAEIARLVPAVAEKISDPETKAVLLETAQVIDRHIQKATVAVEAEMGTLNPDPVNPPIR